MENKVYTIQGIRVVTVPDDGRFGCDWCMFNTSLKGCYDTLDGEESCARKHFHYEREPVQASVKRITVPLDEKTEIERLYHRDCHSFTIEHRSFHVYRLHDFLMLFIFDKNCGEYIYSKTFSCLGKGVDDCILYIENELNLENLYD
jgi:hypothetical protein